jgi:hypothetical protein
MKARLFGLFLVLIGMNACSYDKMSDFGDSLYNVPLADNSDSSDNTSTKGNPQDFKSDYDMYKNKGYSDSNAYKYAYAAEANEQGVIPDTSLVQKPK